LRAVTMNAINSQVAASPVPAGSLPTLIMATGDWHRLRVARKALVLYRVALQRARRRVCEETRQHRPSCRL
jgi:hypothetical protein